MVSDRYADWRQTQDAMRWDSTPFGDELSQK
jgi:hypothetical protein